MIKSRRLRWVGHVARMEEGRSAFKILTVTPAGKRPLETPKRRLEDNIRMDLKEIVVYSRNWIDSAQDRNYWIALVNCGTKPLAFINHEIIIIIIINYYYYYYYYFCLIA